MAKFIRRPIEVTAYQHGEGVWEWQQVEADPVLMERLHGIYADLEFRRYFAPADEEAAEALKTCGCEQGAALWANNAWHCAHCGALIAEGV